MPLWAIAIPNDIALKLKLSLRRRECHVKVYNKLKLFLFAKTYLSVSVKCYMVKLWIMVKVAILIDIWGLLTL